MPRETGSPGFSGSKLREAREARLMTPMALSESVGVSRGNISSYEHGRHNPSPEILQRIADVLNLKTDFFLRLPETLEETVIFERSRSSATKATRKRAQHRRTWLRETMQFLTQFVEIPQANLPNLALPNDTWKSTPRNRIEALATDTRRHWRMQDGPISNMTLLSENNGVIMCLISMNANNLDAFSLWDPADKRPYIALGTDTQSAFRTRFTVAHELAHLILHRNLSETDINEPNTLKLIEKQADQFAASILTPATAFSDDVRRPTLDQFRMLKPRWRTSIKMMIHRAAELDIINREEERKLYINYNRRGWNTTEPLDEETKVERPRLPRKIFETIVDGGILTPSQIATALPFNIEDIESLAALPGGYLDEESAFNWAINELNSGFLNQ